jgi:uncharacterized membrane protein YhaH (DUF805 family)
MVEAYKRFFANYANFKGRSTRSDYWWVVLCNIIIGFVLGFLDGLLGTEIFYIISYIYDIVILIPGIAISVRRLHDINKSGWYCLIALIPFVGSIILLIYMCTASVNEGNQYGEVVK